MKFWYGSFSKPHSSSVASAPSRHSESPLCCMTSTSGSSGARARVGGGERCAVGLDGLEHLAVAEVGVVRDGEHVAAVDAAEALARSSRHSASGCGSSK